MDKKPVVSLCLPTNGVSEWVFPVLDSIFNQNTNEDDFEVVITDNGDNIEFKEKMKEYLVSRNNIVYAETNALPFLNEIESYKRASGSLIKFVNHRTKLTTGALSKLIDFVRKNIEDKPIVYFSNGMLDFDSDTKEYSTFDEFVRNLSYWSSWSTGMTIWKEDFDKLPANIECFNELFPHTTVLFHERSRKRYIIDNTIIMDELPTGKRPKGSYDLFWAFGVEYPGIICDLFRDGDICNDTFKYVLSRNLDFIAELYFEYCIKKNYCSYDLSGLDKMYGVFYRKADLDKKTAEFISGKVAKKLKIKRK